MAKLALALTTLFVAMPAIAHASSKAATGRAAQAAGSETQDAALGAVSARLSFDRDPESGQLTNVTLAIASNGAQEAAIPIPPPCRDCTIQLAGGTDRPSLHALDLDADGIPEVVADIYSGGAHCCTYAEVFRRTPAGWTGTRHNFADPGYELRNLDADTTPELFSADASFAFQFTDFADSGFPVAVWHVRAGIFEDVTARFRTVIASDSRRWLRFGRSALRRHGDPRGVLAAWAADECRLGRGAAAFRSLDAHARRHQLRGASGFSIGPNDGAYVRKLRRFLSRRGYC